MQRSMSWLLTGVLGLVIVGMARPAAAQDAPKVEVAGGWNYIAARSQASDEWDHLYKGGFGDVAVGINSKWSAVGNVAYNQKTETDVGGEIKIKAIPYLFGVRYSIRTEPERPTPFLQFLAGATRLSATQGSDSAEETAMSWQGGVGINVPVNGRLFARAGFDYLHIHGKDGGDLSGGEAVQGLRISAGVGVGF